MQFEWRPAFRFSEMPLVRRSEALVEMLGGYLGLGGSALRSQIFSQWAVGLPDVIQQPVLQESSEFHNIH